MKRLLLLLSFLLISACSTDTETPREEISKFAQANQSSINKNDTLNIAEAMFGCATVETMFDWAQSGSLKVAYECQREDNRYNDLANDLRMAFATILGLVYLCIIFVVAFTRKLETIQTLMAHNHRKKLITNEILELLLTAFAFTTLFFGIAFAFIFGAIYANITSQAIHKAQTAKDDAIYIPFFDSKQSETNAIQDYIACTYSNEYKNSTQDRNIYLYKTNDSYVIRGSFELCDLNGSFLVGKKTIDLAEKYNANITEQIQVDSFNKSFEELISNSSSYAAKFTRGNQSSSMRSLMPETVDCSNINTVNPTYFEEKELAKYKLKYNECLSRDFVFSQVRASGMTQEKIDYQDKVLGTRKIHICDDGVFNKQGQILSVDLITEKYKQCVINNCADILSTTSFYTCSASIEKLDSMTNGNFDFFNLPAINNYLNASTSKYEDAKKILNSFNATFEMKELETYSLRTSKAIHTFIVPNNYGYLTGSQIRHVLSKEIVVIEEQSTDISLFETAKNFFSSEGGLLNSDRFSTCTVKPYSDTGKYDCQSSYYEAQLTAAVLYKAAVIIDRIQKFLTPSKNLKKDANAGIEIADKKQILSSLNVNKDVLALLTPILFDQLGSLESDIFDENAKFLAGNNGLIYTLVIMRLYSEELDSLLTGVKNTLYLSASALFYSVLLIPFFVLLPLYVFLIYSLTAGLTIQKINLLTSIGANTTRKDLDMHASVIYFIETMVIMTVITCCFYLGFIFFQAAWSIVIGDPREFLLNAASIDSQSNTMINVIIFFFSIGLYIMLYVLAMKTAPLGVEVMRKLFVGEVSQDSLRIEGINETRNFAKNMRNKTLWG